MRVLTSRALAIVASIVTVLPLTAQADTTTSHGYSTFGELKYPTDFSHFDYANPEAPQGGEISMQGYSGADFYDNFNPFIRKGVSAAHMYLHVYDALMVRAWDEPDALYGLLAESIEYPDDKSWAIFNLRPEARFHDGTPVTAADVAFSLEMYQSEGRPWYRTKAAVVASSEVLSDTRIRINFVEDAGPAGIADVAILAILPSHTFGDGKVAFNEAWDTPPIGSGPYEITGTDIPRSVTYCKTDDYWGADLAVNAGQDNFGCVVYEYYADDGVALEAFKAGEMLFRQESKSSAWMSSYDFPAVGNGWVKRTTVPRDASLSFQGYWINTRRPHLQDLRVREALGLAMNFQWTNETQFHNLYYRLESFFMNSDLMAVGRPGDGELALLEPLRDALPAAVFDAPAYIPPAGATSPIDRTSFARANALLDDAGWRVGDDGLRRNAKGELLTIEFNDNSRTQRRSIEPYAENLKALGIDIQYAMFDSAQMREMEQVFDYDMTVIRLPISANPGSGLRNIFGSEAATTEGSWNFSGIANPAVDALIETMANAQTRTELATAGRALDRVLRAQHIWVPNWTASGYFVAHWDVFGYPDTPPGGVLGQRFWWFEQDKYEALRSSGALR